MKEANTLKVDKAHQFAMDVLKHPEQRSHDEGWGGGGYLIRKMISYLGNRFCLPSEKVSVLLKKLI